MSAFEFVITAGGQGVVAFPSAKFVIGSAASCALQFPEGAVEPLHAEVMLDPTGTPWIRDVTGQGLLSINGKVLAKAQLTSGCVVKLGAVELMFRPSAGALDMTGRSPTPFQSPVAERMDATARRPTPFQAPAAYKPALTPTERSPAPAPSLAGMPLGGTSSGAKPVQHAALGSDGEALPAGYIINDRYKIIGKLAAGGMGEVYRAEHIELGKAFALKVMRPELSGDADFVARFKREAISASRIGQQNIVDISDFGQTQDGRFFFVMEFLEGLTLASLVHRQGALSVDRVTNIGLQTARALAAAHSQGIVHRDMKPENVMVLQRPGQADFVKVLDFGVAKISSNTGGSQTQMGLVVGTPQYMAPEQAKGVAVDGRTDIYALGLILYEMVAGKPAFNGETPSMLIVKQVTELPPPFEPTIIGSIPEALHSLVFQMLEKDADRRPQTMEDVINVLDSLSAQLRVGTSGVRGTSGKFPPMATPLPLTGAMSGNYQAIRTSGAFAQPTNVGPAPVPDEEPIVAPKSKAPLAIGAVLGVLVLGGVGFALLGHKTPDPVIVVAPQDVVKPAVPVEPLPQVPPTPVVAELKKVKLTLTSEPTGAEVSEGDVAQGSTPLELTREPGSVATLTFKLAGHASVTKKVAFNADGQTLAVTLEKEKKAPAAGTGAVKKPGNGDELKDPFANDGDLKDLPQ